jgi:hypothetical protein
MFGPSVKSVPGWWVSIVPMLIGEPVAATPGFGPHEDVLVETGALELELAAAEVVALLELLLLLLLLPHPASAISESAANSASATRLCGMRCLVLTDCLLSSGCEPGPGPPEVGRY